MFLVPFRLAGVQLFINSRRLRASYAPLPKLQQSTFVALTFNYQNNSVRGDSIGNGHSGHQHTCSMHHILYRV